MGRRSGGSCTELLKVLADKTRLGIVRELMSGAKCVSDINRALAIEQTLLSHHLKVLREKKFVVSERRGKSVLYRLTPGISNEREFQAIDLGCCLLTFKEKIEKSS